MGESMQIVVMFLLLIVVFLLTRVGVVWRVRRAALYVMKDLQNRGAIDPASATPLPYAKRELFRIGIRDFRPKALQSLIQEEIVGITEDGRYYLKKRIEELPGLAGQ
jgi:hypothetical protein